MSQSCFSLRFISHNSLWKLSTFCGYKGIYSRVWKGMWKVIFLQNKMLWRVASDSQLATRMSHEFQSPNNRMVRLYFLSCSDPSVLIFQLPACFTRMTLLVSHHSQVNREMLFDAHTWSILHTLLHTILT